MPVRSKPVRHSLAPADDPANGVNSVDSEAEPSRRAENDERSSWRRPSSELAVRAAEVAKQRNSTYRVLADRIDTSDTVLGDAISDGIRARWEFGQALLAERGTRKQLPTGRLAEVCELAGKEHREIQRWVQFAEQYPTEDQVRLAGRTSWTRIKASLTRAPKPAPEEPVGNRTLQEKHAQRDQPIDRLAQYAVPENAVSGNGNGSANIGPGHLDKHAQPECDHVCPVHPARK